MNETRTPGLALLCDRAGVIQKILCDDIFTASPLRAEHAFAEWVDWGSREKLNYMLAEVNAHGSAFDWELNVPIQGQLRTLYFLGVLYGASVLMVATRNRDGILQFYDELMRINNEQFNALRSALKDQTVWTLTQDQRDNGLYDELSRLNNELITLQRELAKQNAELERLNQQKNQFLGMAAHDLRNPLSVIITYSDFLAQEIAPQLNAEQKEFLDIIRTSSQFMRRLIEDLLDVSAIEAGQLVLNLQPTDLALLARHNVALNRVLASQQQRELFLTCADDLPRLMADQAKLDQVLNNLISNAVKYSFPATAIHIDVKRDGDWVVLSIQDHGQGIPASELDRLFKAFSRTSTKSMTGEKSTGLGLAIASKIIQGHHGKIWAESIVGDGSTFCIALPVSGNQE